MKKALLSLMICMFGVFTVPTAVVFADPGMGNTAGGYEEPSDEARQEGQEDTLDHFGTAPEAKYFYEKCLEFSSAEDCQKRYNAYWEAYLKYATSVAAIDRGENVEPLPEPIASDYMPVAVQPEPQPVYTGPDGQPCSHEGCC